MKARGGRFLLILGAGLAAMAFVVVYIVLSKGVGGASQAASVPQEVPMTTVAVVSLDIPAYTILDATNVGTTDIDASTAVSNTTTSPASLYGKMTLVPMTKGQQIVTNQLTQTGFSDVLAKGEHAFTLAVPERNTFGDALTENDHVDVLWTAKFKINLKAPTGEPGKFTVKDDVYTSTKTLLQDVHVLRVISLRPPPPPSSQGNNGQAQEAAAVKASPSSAMYAEGADYQSALVLGVTDQQAEVLKFARENGLLDLTLRSSNGTVKDAQGKDVKGDHDVEKTTGVTIDTLISNYGVLPPPTIQP